MKRPEYLTRGDLARLIPVANQAELRNVAITGAVLMAVNEFAEAVLSPLGAPVGKRSKIYVWTEPCLKGDKLSSNERPDALIVVDSGRRIWRALVEAKVKSTDLDASQVERYLDIAKNQGIDAVLTISNQFVPTQTQSPVNVNRQRFKKISLLHWSWSYLKTEAKIQLSRSAVSDPEQAYILDEYVRYLEHDTAGVSDFDQMGKAWVEACKLYFAKSQLDRNSPIGASVVSDWDELMRCTALLMSRDLDTNVTTVLTPKERKEPESRLKTMTETFIKSGIVESKLSIPNAASDISVEADLARRSVTVSMTLDAPSDKKRASATVTWLLRQLSKTEDGTVLIVANWPGRAQDTCVDLARLRDDPESLVAERKGQLPKRFVIKVVSDLGGKFTQRRNFVPALISQVTKYYNSIGQYLVPWQAPPPKPKKVNNPLEEIGSNESSPEVSVVSPTIYQPFRSFVDPNGS